MPFSPWQDSHFGEIGGNGLTVSALFTRPANTTAYAAKDAVNDSTSAPTILTFTDILRKKGGSGYITKARLTTDQSTCVARFRLWLFYTAAPTIAVDNAAFTLMWADRSIRLGYIDFAACSTEGSGSDCAQALNSDVRLLVSQPNQDANLYGLLETLDAFTPGSGQNFRLSLGMDRN